MAAAQTLADASFPCQCRAAASAGQKKPSNPATLPVATAINVGEETSTPWGWLAGAGALLLGLSLMATVVLHPDNRGQGYVPAEAHPGGRVTPAGFDPKLRHPPVSDRAPNTAP